MTAGLPDMRFVAGMAGDCPPSATEKTEMLHIRMERGKSFYSGLLFSVSQQHCHQGIGLTVSLGVAECPAHALEPETLVGAADRAMYDAKRAGRSLATVARIAGTRRT
jgi:GGDEF domain-containing protein